MVRVPARQLTTQGSLCFRSATENHYAYTESAEVPIKRHHCRVEFQSPRSQVGIVGEISSRARFREQTRKERAVARRGLQHEDRTTTR